MKERPLVSVIMASYAHAPYIAAAIESLRRQDYDRWELIIVDDASPDNTLDVLKTFSDDERIRVFPLAFNRQCHVRTFAAKHARGDYLAFLNSDDLWQPGKLAGQIEFLEKNSSHAAVFTIATCIDAGGKPIPGHALEGLFDQPNRSRHEWLRHFFIFGNCLCLSSAVIRRSSFDKVGGFNPHLIQISDLDLWIRTCLSSRIHIIPEPLTAMRVLPGDGNLSGAGHAMASRYFIESQEVFGRFFEPEGLAQMSRIFPELASSLPQDTPQWQCYVLCQFASGLKYRHMRLLAFSRLHALLADGTSRQLLQEHNCRILRTLVFSEAAASLDSDRPGATWRLWLPDDSGSWPPDKSYSHWTHAAEKGLVCFSFPNPRTSGPLRLAAEDNPIPLVFDAVRLYDQKTGVLISTPVGRQTKNFFDFPRVEMASIDANWLDIEIEYSARRRNLSRRIGEKLWRWLTSAL